MQLQDGRTCYHGFLTDCVEQSFLPSRVEHRTGARIEGCCVKPLSFGVACFCSILRNPLTMAGIASKPPGPSYSPSKCSARSPASPALQPWGRTYKVSYTGPELLQEVPSTSRNITFFWPASHTSPALSKHTHGHSEETNAGNPCAGRIHFQDPPPRKLMPRHQLPQENSLLLAGLLEPLQTTR